MVMRFHELKCDPRPFRDLLANRKTHEIRFDDRQFRVGDWLLLRETVNSAREMRDGSALAYTGFSLSRRVTHIQRGYGLQEGWVVLSLEAV